MELARRPRIGSIGVNAWIKARPLYDALQERRWTRTDVLREVFAPWFHETGSRFRALLQPVTTYGYWWRRGVRANGWNADLSEELYALSRVIDVLLLGLQPSIDPALGRPAAHNLHGPDGWPTVTHPQLTDATSYVIVPCYAPRNFAPCGSRPGSSPSTRSTGR